MPRTALESVGIIAEHQAPKLQSPNPGRFGSLPLKPGAVAPEWLGEAKSQSVRDWEDWSTAVCLANGFVTEVGMGESPDRFERWVVGQFNRSPPYRAKEAREKVEKLVKDDDVWQLSGLACDGLDTFRSG